MQAPTLSRAVELRKRLGQCYSILDNNGQYAVSSSTLYLGAATGRCFGCSCSHNSTGGLESGAGIRLQPSSKLSLFPEKCGAHSVWTEVSESRSVLRLRGYQIKAGWRSPWNFCRQTFDRDRLVVFEKSFETLTKIASEVQSHAQQISFEFSTKQVANDNVQWNWSTLMAVAVSLIVLAAPGPTCIDSSLTFSNYARADQLAQLRQTASVLEKAVEGLTKVRFDGDVGRQVLDKALTVVTGSSFIDPELLDKEVDGLLSGEKNLQEELKNGFNSAVQNSWSTVVDVVTNFNPGALSESAGASISTFLETGAERIAAFELSALVSLGERWLILTPLLLIPMAWEMNRLQKKSEKAFREGQEKFEELSGQAQLRGEKVRRELERIELRTQLLDAVSSLGKTALQPPRMREEAGLIRRRIKVLLERLEELKPIQDPLLLVPEFASAVSASNANPSEALAYVPARPTVDGDWKLIFVSETNNMGRQQELPQFPGVGLDNIRQKVWQMASTSPLASDLSLSPLLARNTAEIRLGPLGVFQVAVQGIWENLKDGQRALVSFDTFSARPVELLGNKLSADVPELNVSLPPALQRRAEWGIVYVDNHVRINRGSQGQLFLFRKIE